MNLESTRFVATWHSSPVKYAAPAAYNEESYKNGVGSTVPFFSAMRARRVCVMGACVRVCVYVCVAFTFKDV